jgi:hypothetical protein
MYWIIIKFLYFSSPVYDYALDYFVSFKHLNLQILNIKQ